MWTKLPAPIAVIAQPSLLLILLPILIVVSVMVVLTLLLLNKLSRPKPKNVCIHCGYDLRATPTRCPECGRAVDAADAP